MIRTACLALSLAAAPALAQQAPVAPVTASAPSSPVADTVWQPAQGSAATPAARSAPAKERTDTGRHDGAPGQAHETHGTPNPRNPDPR